MPTRARMRDETKSSQVWPTPLDHFAGYAVKHIVIAYALRKLVAGLM